MYIHPSMEASFREQGRRRSLLRGETVAAAGRFDEMCCLCCFPRLLRWARKRHEPAEPESRAKESEKPEQDQEETGLEEASKPFLPVGATGGQGQSRS